MALRGQDAYQLAGLLSQLPTLSGRPNSAGGMGGAFMQMGQQARQEAQRKQTAEKLQGLLGQRAQINPYQQSEAEIFPGEQPVQGLHDIQPGSGLLGGEIGQEEFYGGLLSTPGYEQLGAKGMLGLQEAQIKMAGQSPTSPYDNVKQDDKGNWWGLNKGTGTVEQIPVGGRFTQYKTIQGTDDSGMPITQLVDPATGETITVGSKPRSGAESAQIANARSALKDLNTVKAMMFEGATEDGTLPETATLRRSTAFAGDVPFIGGMPGTKGRDARQSLRRAIETILRARSGAAVPPDEVNNYMELYAPSPFDSDAAARDKINRLDQFFEQQLELMQAGTQQRTPPPPPGFQIVE